MRRKLSVFLLVSFFTATSSLLWAGFFLQGAKKAKRDPSDVMVKYRIEPCVMVSDGSTAGAPAVDYWLFEEKGKLTLYERSGPNDGSFIQNHWTENDGDHFFVWVRGSHGWEYIIPQDRRNDAVRLVYPKGTYEGETNAQGARVPVGSAMLQCVLKPSYVSEAVAPEPEPAPEITKAPPPPAPREAVPQPVPTPAVAETPPTPAVAETPPTPAPRVAVPVQPV